ncbi:MAG: sigma-70 family RNA polymerase sigma factor [Acidimicrobiia bacterium]
MAVFAPLSHQALLPERTDSEVDTFSLESIPCSEDVAQTAIERVDLSLAAGRLPKRERRILYLRFVKDLTQSEIGERLGVSQMHVSRLLVLSPWRRSVANWSRRTTKERSWKRSTDRPALPRQAVDLSSPQESGDRPEATTRQDLRRKFLLALG